MSASLHSIAVISSFLNSPSLATICRPVQAPKHYIVTFFKAALVSCRPIRHPVLVFPSNAKSIATQTSLSPLIQILLTIQRGGLSAWTSLGGFCVCSRKAKRLAGKMYGSPGNRDRAEGESDAAEAIL